MDQICQRWRDRRDHYRVVGEEFARHAYEVEPIEESQARPFVERHHYSASYPAARLAYGLREGAQLVGVAVLSVPVQKAVLTKVFPHLAAYSESLELGRFVLLDAVPALAEGWFLSRVWDLAATDGVRGVVSFSDPVKRRTAEGVEVFAGHLGIIYQATNALWTGRAKARTVALLPDARILNERAISKVRAQEQGHEAVERKLVDLYGARVRRPGQDPVAWLEAALVDIGVRKLRHPGCLRYAFTLGNRRERRAVQLGVPVLAPYPKSEALVG